MVLFSLGELTYPHATPKIAAWVLLAMGRLSRRLRRLLTIRMAGVHCWCATRSAHSAALRVTCARKRRGPTGGPKVEARAVSLHDLAGVLSRFAVLDDRRRGRYWSPTRYADGATSRGNAGVQSVSCLVFDLDRVPPDEDHLAGLQWIGHTTWSHTTVAPPWRVVIPLARPVPAKQWADVWQRARAALCPEADPACKDPSRAYWLPSCPARVTSETSCHPGPLLDPATLPKLPPEPKRPELRRSPTAAIPRSASELGRRRGEAYMAGVLANLEHTVPGGRNTTLNAAVFTLGRWIAAGRLEQTVVENALYAAAERNGLVADDGHRQCWATIRSGLSAGLQQPSTWMLSDAGYDRSHTSRGGPGGRARHTASTSRSAGAPRPECQHARTDGGPFAGTIARGRRCRRSTSTSRPAAGPGQFRRLASQRC